MGYARRGLAFLLLALIALAAFTCFWKVHLAETQKQQDQARMKELGIRRVQASALYDHALLLKTASEYSGKDIVRFNDCTWFAGPMWGLSQKNPNWFFYSEKIDGVHLICYIDGFEASGGSTEYAFEWDVTDGSVSSFKVRLSDLFDGE